MADDIQPINDNKPNPAEVFQAMLTKNNNDGVKLASQLFDENFQYRNQIRELKKAQPKDGALVLSTDDAAAFNEYKQFLAEAEVDLKQIKETLSKAATLEQENKQLARSESEREAAEAAGFKVGTLRKLMRDFPDAVYEIRTQKDKDGTEAKVAFIRNGDKESPLTEFAKENFNDFLPALKQGEAPNPNKPTGTTAGLPPAGQATNTAVETAARGTMTRRTFSI